jgi:hypothetical protein
MPKTRIYIQDGEYYGSLSGNRIKAFNPKRHEIVAPSLDRDARDAFKAARDARLDEKRPRGVGSRGGKPKLPGIRAEATRLYEGGKAAAVAIGNPYDGPADKNTARMIVKLFRHDPALHAHFLEIAADRRSHYYKYNPVSHSIEMYTHKQAYLGSFQLPAAIRHKRSAEVNPNPSHYVRKRYPGGKTKVYTTPDAALRMMPHRDLTRGPLNTEYHPRGPAPRLTPQQRLAKIDREFYGRPDVFGVRTILVDAEGNYIRPEEDMYGVD